MKDLCESSTSGQRDARFGLLLEELRRGGEQAAAGTDGPTLLSRVCTEMVDSLDYHGAWAVLTPKAGASATYVAGATPNGAPDALRIHLEHAPPPACVAAAMAADETVLVDRCDRRCPACPLVDPCRDEIAVVHRLACGQRAHGALFALAPPHVANDVEERRRFAELANGLAQALSRVFGSQQTNGPSGAQQGEDWRLSLLRDAPVGVFAARSTGELLAVNAEMARILGFSSPAEALACFENNTDAASIRPERRRELLRQLRRNGFTANYECDLRTADGRVIWLNTSAWVSRRGDDDAFEFGGVCSRIEGREDAENARRRLWDMATDLMCVADIDTATFIQINPAFERVLGYSREELLSRSFMEYVHPDDVEATLAVVQNRLREGEAVAEFENRYRCKDGSYRIFEWNSHPVTAEGVTYAIAHDVTERRHNEQLLRDNEAFTYAVLNHLPVGVAVNTVDPAVDFAFVNDNFAKFYRTTRAALSDSDAFWNAVYEDPEFRESMRKRVLEDCASGDPERMFWPNVPIARRGKETRYITARNTPVPDKNIMISTVWDVTALKRAEDERALLEAQLHQSQKMEAVGRLAGGVAHDFNNMLQTILGYADILLGDVADDHPHHEALVEIHKAAQRSADLTRQLLAFARKQTIAPQVLDLNEAVEGMLKMLKRLIGEDVELRWEPDRDAPPVKMDPAQVHQILTNLVVNARDAIASVGTIAIETSRADIDEQFCADHVDASPGQYTVLTVSDTGEGMEAEVLAQIFEPFFSTKPTGEGTGLGLATVYGIVKQNGGFIHIRSEPREGTTVRIHLHSEQRTPAAVADEAPSAAPPIGDETVLLVEDEHALLTLNERILEQLGYTTLTASRPEEALQIAQSYPNDIHMLITDVVMPQMSGRDLWSTLSQARPQMRCLFMSGYTADIIAQRGVLDEGLHFLQKPFSSATLARKVRDILDA